MNDNTTMNAPPTATASAETSRNSTTRTSRTAPPPGQDFCKLLCQLDAQCGGVCSVCQGGVCTAPQDCGNPCEVDSDCALSACNKCIGSRCGGLPCRSPCGSGSWCGPECGACAQVVESATRNVSVCVNSCDKACTVDAECGSPCPLCATGRCRPDASLSAGAVAAIAVLCTLCVSAVVVLICIRWFFAGKSGGAGIGYVVVFVYLICAGIVLWIVLALVVGLSLGLSPSICCL